MFDRKLIASIIFFLAGKISLRSFVALAKLFSLAYYNFNIKSKSIVKENLKKMHIKFSINQYLNFAQFLSENIYLNNNEIKMSRFAFHNLSVLDLAVKSKKPVMLISVHYGNWELAGQALQRLGYNMTVIYEKKTDWIYEYIDRIRVKYGLRLINKDASLKDVKSEIEDGRIMVFLIDHKSTNTTLKQLDFLGVETDLPYGWYRLIQKFDAEPICILTRYENHKHNIYLFNARGLKFEEYYRKFERMIRKDIFQYDFYNQMWKDISR
ncbi:MAG: lysophospholipid acyltransferase family protein [bacterium]